MNQRRRDRTLASAVIDHDWRAASADVREIWMYHVLRLEAETMLFPNLPAFLEGTYQPANQCERIAFVGAAQFNGLTWRVGPALRGCLRRGPFAGE